MDKKSPKGRKRGNKAKETATPSTSSSSQVSASSSGVGNSSEDNNYWDCSVCTFRNNAEAFKCSMCDVRKGTSTRKPRINPDLVAAQHAQALTPPPSSSASGPLDLPDDEDDHVDDDDVDDEDVNFESAGTSTSTAKSARKTNPKESGNKKQKVSKETKKTPNPNRARLKNVDRNSATYHSVTVNDITVVITEFKPKPRKERKPKASNSVSSTSSSKAGEASSSAKSEPSSANGVS